ncbi:MAG: Uma2 family endonuclease [Lachnospiraceae bacterium]|nr:Uma2 family endonuclease [Lachnospiraceae bacterium]
MPLPKEQFYTAEDYWNTPEGERMELIEGHFYAQVAPSRAHQDVLSFLHAAVYNYIQTNGGSCRVYPAPFAVQLSDADTTIVEPDISVICNPDKLNDKGCKGAPDWIIEIVSPSSKRMDYYTKLALYRAAGVREYWIVDPLKKVVIVYNMEHDDGPVFYPLSEKVKAHIYDNLEIDFSQLRL